MAGTLFAKAKQKVDGLKSAHAQHTKRLAAKRPRVEQEAPFEEPPDAGAPAEGDDGAAPPPAAE
eukprot:2756400-Pyramimonas_sp.AAC.1